MGIQVKDCRHGRFMYLENDVYIGQSLARYGEYSEDEVKLWSQMIKPGWRVIDAGANIGVHTVWFAKQVGPLGEVVAFEPQRMMYNILCGNLALNNLLNVRVAQMALGDKTGEVDVPAIDYNRIENFGGVSLGSDRPVGERVPLGMIDSIARETVHFIKIDVEGMELNVLNGATRTVQRDRPIIYCENDRIEQSEKLIAWLMTAGYRLYWHITRAYSDTNFMGDKTNVYPGVACVNMLCVHSEARSAINGMTEIRTAQDKSGINLEPYAAAVVHGRAA